MPALTIQQNAPTRILIIGAGVSGLFAAWRLAEAGREVHVFDQGEAGRGALWASGGMLGAGFEACVELGDQPQTEAMSTLFQHSLGLWDHYGPLLDRVSPTALGLSRPGTITPVFQSHDLPRLDALAALADKLGLQAERLTPSRLDAIEPTLGGSCGAIKFHGDGHLDNRALAEALIAICKQVGVQLHPHTPIERLDWDGDRVVGAITSGDAPQRFAGDHVMLASGAIGLSGEAPALYPLTPVKGQMIAFEGVETPPFHVIRGFNIYITAKPGGRVVVGATSEPGVHDNAIDEEACARLAERARMVVPALAQARLVERWAGSRPATADHLPLVGKSKYEGLSYLAGGYRNGVLMGPAYGEAALAIVQNKNTFLTTHFSPGRLGL